MPTHAPSRGSADLFARDAGGVLPACRQALARLVEALPDRIRTASDLQRTLQVDAKLAWQVFRFIHSGTAAGAVFLPGTAGLRRIAAAARRRRVPRDLIESLSQTIDRFDALITEHAGDRETFDSMISGGAGEDDALTLRHKRAAFRANRHLRGAQAHAQIKSMIVRPSRRPHLLDLVGIQGYTDLRRIRLGGSIAVSRVRISNDEHSVRSTDWEPLGHVPGRDPASSPLAPFCTPDLPPFRAVRTSSNFVISELLGHALGNQSAITYIDGYLARATVPRYRDADNRYGAMHTGIPIPCEVFVLDLLVHEAAFPAISPTVGCFSTNLHDSGLPDRMDSCERLPINESVLRLGRGLAACECSDLPRHASMYQSVFRHLDWPPDEFEVFRCRIAYPVMLSHVLLRFDLPDRPDDLPADG